MIPAAFRYRRAQSVAHALELLQGDGDADGGARLMAGGQSLLPMMKLRLAAPETVVDISELDDLRYVRREGSTVAIGAGTRYFELLQSDVIRQSVPLLARATARIGDPQIRYRGTIGGSLAHADPAADLPAAVLALDGTVVIRHARGDRAVRASDFFVDYFTTDLSAGDLLTEVRIPATGAEKCAYQRFSSRANMWPIIAVAVAGTRIALAGMGPTPLRAFGAEDVLASGGDFAAAAELADYGATPIGDRHADPGYRRHLARVLTLRALEAAHRR